MIWKALFNDGTVLHEFENGVEFKLTDIQKANLNRFKITETGNEDFVDFSADSGVMKFHNLDLQKLNQLEGLEGLVLLYDAERQLFKMTPDSLEFFNTLTLKDESTYNNIEFDQSGLFRINGDPFHLEFHMGDKKFVFLDQPPYTDIIHYKNAFTEFIGRANSPNPYKRIDNTTAYAIGYNKEYKFDSLYFNLSLTLLYEVINRTVTMLCAIGCNERISGQLIANFGDRRSSISAQFYPNLPPTMFNRMITQLG